MDEKEVNESKNEINFNWTKKQEIYFLIKRLEFYDF